MRCVDVNKATLAKARERRRALDRERDDQDLRIEEAAAVALVAVDRLAAARRAVEGAEGEVGDAIRALLGVGIAAGRAAALLEMDAAEVRRYAKRANAAPVSGTPSASAGLVAQSELTPTRGAG